MEFGRLSKGFPEKGNKETERKKRRGRRIFSDKQTVVYFQSVETTDSGPREKLDEQAAPPISFGKE
jgi:hypothetical protein